MSATATDAPTNTATVAVINCNLVDYILLRSCSQSKILHYLLDHYEINYQDFHNW